MIWDRWLRRKRYGLEDFLSDALPQPSPAPSMKPPLPRPEPAPSPVCWSFCGVSTNRASPEQVSAEWTEKILQAIAKNKYFEIIY
jgi:hypothetical protein